MGARLLHGMKECGGDESISLRAYIYVRLLISTYSQSDIFTAISYDTLILKGL